MHIVIDARTATPHFPGIGRYTLNLIKALAEVLAPNEQLTVLTPPHPPIALARPQVRCLPVAASLFALPQQYTLPWLLRQLRAEVYHSLYYLMPYLPGIPTVLTLYDIIPLVFPEYSTPRARRWFRLTTTLALRASRAAVTLSQSARDDLAREFRAARAPGRLSVIPAAADPCFTPQPPEAIALLRTRYGLPERFLLYLGSNKPHKNLPRLVEAFAQIAGEGVPLVIAGAWDARYPQARERAAALGLEAHLRWLGPLPEADLPALYSAALGFVFPSCYEGFGLPPLEAMACGTPVACSTASSLPEVTGEAALLFDPHSVDAIAGALQRLCADAPLRTELRARGLQQAALFSWHATAQATLNLYRKVAA